VLTASFLALAMGAGLTSAIANPLSTESRLTVQACDLLLGRDPHGMAWIKTHRK
jgi:5-methyltetrahydrofolate--homocysteine methyltransferase